MATGVEWKSLVLRGLCACWDCVKNASGPRESKLRKIGFIGAGQMAKALAIGIAKSKQNSVEFAYWDPSETAGISFEELISPHSSVERASDNQSLIDASEIVFVAVKPQFLDSAIDGLNFEKSSPLVVSIAAGVQISQLKRMTGTKRIVRVMPNTPCLIGQGASALAYGKSVSQSDAEVVEEFLGLVGKVVTVKESLIDSVTGLSGSGPAYVFSFIEALIDGAVLTGMARATARELAIQTVIGAAMMLEQTGEHTAVLRDRVTSPGGTTIAGLKALEENAFRDAVMSAVQASAERSMELGD